MMSLKDIIKTENDVIETLISCFNSPVYGYL